MPPFSFLFRADNKAAAQSDSERSAEYRSVTTGDRPAIVPLRGINHFSASQPPSTLLIEFVTQEIDADDQFMVRIFVNTPDATAMTPITDPGYVGSIGLFPFAKTPSIRRHLMRLPKDFRICADEAEDCAKKDKATVSVVLAPIDQDRPVKGSRLEITNAEVKR